ncbi:alpha-E domain-containing protein [Pelagibius sp. Alg239-R121]|uniref:alpha-E domain-containing protein n=1 Tax=Pelagibius sp. Alg239-R121 TaxID=2993448 RepID=UPI0024A6F48F|nr:alpha-E domain-containing protein [Pelagibius sp. Alg239-R121]
MSKHLLSRYAEAVYWLARYVERTENLARVLDVNETFSRDSRGGQNWQSILQLYRDEERFAETGQEATAENVLYFYALDQHNPSSIISSIHMARENARTLRPLISTEMWIQLNILYNHLRAMTRANLAEPRIARFCSFIKEACQTHTGITEGTFYRDEGWYFYQLGRWIERADQATRLLDVKYHLLLPSVDNVGSPLDVSQWNSVLRSAAGYHAFRRIHPSGMTPTDVTGFLLFHKRFPRSVRACVAQMEALLHDLKTTYDLRQGVGALEQLDALRSGLVNQTADSVVKSGLHEFLDWIQQTLIKVHGELGHDYFGYEEAQ